MIKYASECRAAGNHIDGARMIKYASESRAAGNHIYGALMLRHENCHGLSLAKLLLHTKLGPPCRRASRAGRQAGRLVSAF